MRFTAPDLGPMVCTAGALVLALMACAPTKPSVPPRSPAPVPFSEPLVAPDPGLSASALPSAAAVAPPVAPVRRPDRFAVVPEEAQVSHVALGILDRGGSATDAVIAAMLAAGVVQPVSSGIGGGGFALHYRAGDGVVTALDYRAVAPVGLRPLENDNRPVPFGRRGVMVGVPGEVAGMEEMHRRWGKLAFGELFRPAIGLARHGFTVSRHMHRSLRWRRQWAKSDPRMAGVFAPLGDLLSAGERTQRPNLARTLEKIAAEGADSVYRGVIGEDIVARARAGGSRLLLRDLEEYRVVERAPLSTQWEGKRVYTVPPPSAGGLMLIETLNMHDKAALAAQRYGSGAYWHLLAETMRGANADRMRLIGDPAFVKMDVAALTARQRMRARRARITLDRTNPSESFSVSEKGTHSFIVIDEAGNSVAVTSTVRSLFGARIMTRGGFVLNDALRDFEQPRMERRFRAHRRPNAARGRARPVTSMAPTIVVGDHGVELALAASGGLRMGGAVTQALLAKLAFGRTATEAANDPRVFAPPTGGLYVEAGSSEALLADLRKRGETVIAGRPNYGAVGLIAVRGTPDQRRFDAAADKRKDGVARVRRDP